MSHLYVDAPRLEVYRIIGTEVPKNDVFEYAPSEPRAAVLTRALKLPFVPRAYIHTESMEPNKILFLVHLLVNSDHRVALEDRLGEIKEFSKSNLSIAAQDPERTLAS